MNGIRTDLKHAFRFLMKRPAFTITAMMILAVGIGANTMMFSVVEGVVLRPLPYADSESLVVVWDVVLEEPGDHRGATYPNWRDWRAQSEGLEDIAVYRRSDFVHEAPDREARMLNGVYCSSSFFTTLNQNPEIGRFFIESEDLDAAAPVVVLGHAFWEATFGADVSVVGRTVQLDRELYTIVGVVGEEFDTTPLSIRGKPDVYLPVGVDTNWHEQRSSHVYRCMARLSDGWSLGRAQEEMTTISEGLAERYPDENEGEGVVLIDLAEEVFGDVTSSMILLQAAVALMLLTACANVANMTLARGVSRRREIALRGALGAAQSRVMRQLLCESILVACLAGALGMAMAWLGIDFVVRLVPRDLPRVDEVGVNGAVLLFNFVAAVVAGVLFGLIPSLRASSIDLMTSLKGASRSTPGRRSRRIGRAILIAEVGLAVVLLVGSLLTMRGFLRLLDVDPGYDPRGVLTFRFDLSSELEPDAVLSTLDNVLSRLKRVGGVEDAAVASSLPLVGSIGSSFEIEGRPEPPPGQGPEGYYAAVSPDYFKTMGIGILRGRGFVESDRFDGTGVTLISQELADRYWANEDPIGQRIAPGLGFGIGEPEQFEIVGVVEDTRQWGLAADRAEYYYIPIAQHPWNVVNAVVRCDRDPDALIDTIRSTVGEVLPSSPIYAVGTLDEHLSGSVSTYRFAMLLLGIFAVLAVAMAVAGIYGVISYSVSNQVQEIGTRMALGARRADIMRMIVNDGLAGSGIGIAIGLAGAAVLSRFMGSILFEVSPVDPVTYAGVSAILLVATLAACWVPTRKATSIDPASALR